MIYRSDYHKALEKNKTNELYGLALEKGDCIFLTGSCPTPTPDVVYSKLLGHFEKDNRFCSYNTGSNGLKSEIINYLDRRGGFSVDPDNNILITLGATTFLQQLFLYLLDENSECVVVTPTFQDYFNQIRFTKAKIVEVAMEEQDDEWILNIEKIKQAVTEKTRIILLCSPNNPTGKVYSRDELLEIGLFAKENDLLVVADEAYNYLIYEGMFTSLLQLPEIRDNIVVARTFSKEFSMCGWRVGYSYLPEELHNDMFHLQLSFNSVAAAISQKAAEISLQEHSVQIIAENEVERIKKNRDLVQNMIDQIDPKLSYILPESCPYFYVKYYKDLPSFELCKEMIEKSSVIVSPGSSNGSGGENHFCITFADDISVISEGLERISSYFKTYY